MAFAGPARQRRVTVLLRLLMAIPHFLVLYVLAIAVEVVAVIAWFAGLFTGRLPAGLADFLTGWLRWSARVYAYVGLLTDEYPPFALADADYPVRLSAAPGGLNRLAVLFRLILAIPAWLMLVLTGYGAVVIGIVIWLIVLVTGTMPAPLHQAVAAVVRYGARFYGYFFLMSGTYPGGLFGDPAEPDPRAWRLVLSTGAKRLVGLFIALGAVALVAYIIFTANLVSRSADNATRVDAIHSISAAHIKLIRQLNVLAPQMSACQGQPGTLGCVTKLDQQAAADLGAFGGAVRSTPVPSSAAPAAARLVAVTGRVQSAFQQLGTASSVAQYQQIDSGMVGPRVAQFNAAYQNLGRALGAG
jgi:hypothetical protein